MKQHPKFYFADQVIVDTNLVGVIVKTWESSGGGYYYEVYVRLYKEIKDFDENDIDRYRVRHKFLEGDEFDYQNGI